jgi:hypothetical protein
LGHKVASARDTVVELHFVIADATVGQNVKRGAADCRQYRELPELLKSKAIQPSGYFGQLIGGQSLARRL